MTSSSKCPSDILFFVPYVNWLWYQVDAKQRLNMVFVLQRSMWDQEIIQLPTHNPKSLDAKGFRTLRTIKKVVLDFLMSALVDVVPLLYNLLQKLKARRMIPCLVWFPENIGLLENLWILRPKMNLLGTSLQTNSKTIKHFVWKWNSDSYYQYATWKPNTSMSHVFIEFYFSKISRYKAWLKYVAIN